jgi:cytochrome b6-f complex iron-sulfur subunit
LAFEYPQRRNLRAPWTVPRLGISIALPCKYHISRTKRNRVEDPTGSPKSLWDELERERLMARDEKTDRPDRREFLSNAAMTAGLVGTYGAMGLVLGRFLYPARPSDRSWLFVVEADRMAIDDSIAYRTPEGNAIQIARRKTNGDVGDFVALSSTCPHLGCRVLWEPTNGRFLCPCHNGVFDHNGDGESGPPGDAGLSLSHYNLKLESGLLFIELKGGPIEADRRDKDGRGSPLHQPSSAGVCRS